jgi:glutamate dehydrogenase
MVLSTQRTIARSHFRADTTELESVYFRGARTGPANPPTESAERVFRQHLELAVRRAPAAAIVRVYRTESDLGTAIQIVNDDMPLLVDSVTAALRRLGAQAVEVVHPIYDVVRDRDGRLRGIAPHSGAGGPRRGGHTIAESWIHVQLGPAVGDALLDRIEEAIPHVLDTLRRVVEDTPAMLARLLTLAAELATGSVGEEVECARLLRWLAEGHFTALGYRGVGHDSTDPLSEAAAGLGILRDSADADFEMAGAGASLLRMSTGAVDSALPGASDLCVITVRSPSPDAVEQVFVGTFTVIGLHENILDIPVISRRVRQVIDRAGFELSSFSGQTMLELLQTLPRAELFSLDARRLFETASAVMNLGARRQLRLFLREEQRSGMVYCLVYLPRDRYSAEARLRMQEVLAGEFAVEEVGYSVRVTESELAVAYFTVHRPAGAPAADVSESNRERIQQSLIAATRTWSDRVVLEAAADTTALARRYAAAFPASYQQEFGPGRALADLRRLDRLTEGAIDADLRSQRGGTPGPWRFTLYVAGAEVSLSRVLPLLHSLGVEVVDERPHRIELQDGSQRWICDFNLRIPGVAPTDPDMAAELPGPAPEARKHSLRYRFTDAFAAMWFGHTEVDGLNELVLRTDCSWRQVAVLRAYAAYLRQAGFPYTPSAITRVLLTYPDIARSLLDLFEALFDPDRSETAAAEDIRQRVQAAIDEVAGLDADRILRAAFGLVEATLRTNYFRRGADGKSLQYLSFKLAPHAIAELPKPRPQFEIFVHSPRVEGVHMRFGSVARGGVRWSDRLEDFRTEVLGLAKAQEVKNAVIVPVGAKGGFVVKRPPTGTGDVAVDREMLRAEGVACYRTFISALLDVTDNVDHVSGVVLPPPRVVRRDDDDPYLVVAADKGTATFSDIANDIARSYGFWLGDAFASGGSMGYDHKAMGITAKGAWEAVKRHFAEVDIDTQTQDFTVVGVGDMSGDVFGNGMLLSPHTHLVAAFDHRHIFLDPVPDAASSFAERERLFGLVGSSWADYDRSLISKGGGVYDRSAKAIAVTPQVRAALQLDSGVHTLSPPEMIRAILLAPVDLLWNGGIGTYVKASTESHVDVGDKAGDAVRVNANQLRVTVIGEGGNLGVTPLGRVEFCGSGGRINTDAVDNSGGVDCSDHEVNIKVLLDTLISAGDLPVAERNPLLASMTGEISEIVLRDNISQNHGLGIARAHASAMRHVHRRLITDLEANHGLDRELEALPSDGELRRRAEQGNGLMSPELANLLAHVKLSLKKDLLAGDLLDNTAMGTVLRSYFPVPLRRFGAAIQRHPLRRQIIATTLINRMVDGAGITYAFRLAEETGATTEDAVRAFIVATEVFDLHNLWQRIRAASIPSSVRDELELETRRTLDRASRWMLTNRPQPIAIGAAVTRYREGMRTLAAHVPAWRPGALADDLLERSCGPIDRGAPAELAEEVYLLIHRFPLLDVVDIADIADREPAEVAAIYFALDEHFGIHLLIDAVSGIARTDRWNTLARLAVRDDLYASLRSLTLDVLLGSDARDNTEEKIARWESTNRSRVSRARAALGDISAVGSYDLATLSVAAQQVRSMVNSGDSSGADFLGATAIFA